MKNRLDPPLRLITPPSLAHCLCCLCRFLPAKGRAREMPLPMMEMRLLVKVKGQLVAEGVVRVGKSSLSLPPSPSPPPRTPSPKPGGALYGLAFPGGRAGGLAPALRAPLVKRCLVRREQSALDSGQGLFEGVWTGLVTATPGGPFWGYTPV